MRDPTRGEFGIQNPVDFKRTPSKLGYEIQINNRYPNVTTTGSVYTINKAPTEAMKEDSSCTINLASCNFATFGSRK